MHLLIECSLETCYDILTEWIYLTESDICREINYIQCITSQYHSIYPTTAEHIIKDCRDAKRILWNLAIHASKKHETLLQIKKDLQLWEAKANITEKHIVRQLCNKLKNNILLLADDEQ